MLKDVNVTFFSTPSSSSKTSLALSTPKNKRVK